MTEKGSVPDTGIPSRLEIDDVSTDMPSLTNWGRIVIANVYVFIHIIQILITIVIDQMVMYMYACIILHFSPPGYEMITCLQAPPACLRPCLQHTLLTHLHNEGVPSSIHVPQVCDLCVSEVGGNVHCHGAGLASITQDWENIISQGILKKKTRILAPPILKLL